MKIKDLNTIDDFVLFVKTHVPNNRKFLFCNKSTAILLTKTLLNRAELQFELFTENPIYQDLICLFSSCQLILEKPEYKTLYEPRIVEHIKAILAYEPEQTNVASN